VTGSGGGLVGDWFPCENAACSEVDDDGTRFRSDLTWHELEAPGDFSPTNAAARYCEQDEGGTYTYEGSTLTLSFGPNGQAVFTATINGDTLTIVESEDGGSGKQILLKRVSSSRSLGACKESGAACTQEAECKTGSCTNGACEGAPPPPEPGG